MEIFFIFFTQKQLDLSNFVGLVDRLKILTG